MLSALAGGVGAARFLRGLIDVVDPRDLTVVVNTADDDRFHGLHVSPDVDSVVYTLADANDPATGWGLADETFRVMESLERFGAPTWFRLGDRDLATHLHRTERLRTGATLGEVTAELARSWGLACRVLPMTDDEVRTRIEVREPGGGTTELAMQEWFVREGTRPPLTAVRFAGAEAARPAPGVLEALETATAIVVCPSNPVISIGPILAVPGIRDVLAARRDHVIGISPIVGGRAVKGPADRMLGALGIEASCVGVAGEYRDLCATWVIDAVDTDEARRVEALGLRCVVADTLMRDPGVAAALARTTLAALP